MSGKNLKELNKTIELLSDYRDRLQKEVITIAKKLQMPQSKIESTIENHSELIEVNQAINNLIKYRNNTTNQVKYN